MKQLLTIFILLTLVGCYTTKKANKDLSKIGNKYPELLAKVARDKFPCITTTSDTIIQLVDSLVYVTCPDDYLTHIDTVIVNGKTIYKTDTLTVINGKKVPVFIPAKTIFITTKIEDSAKIKLLAKENLNLKAVIVKKDKKIASQKTFLWITGAGTLMLILSWLLPLLIRKFSK